MDNNSDLRLQFLSSNPQQPTWLILELCCIKINILFVEYQTAVTDIQQASQMNRWASSISSWQVVHATLFYKMVRGKLQEKRREEIQPKRIKVLCKGLPCGTDSHMKCLLTSKLDMQNPLWGKLTHTITMFLALRSIFNLVLLLYCSVPTRLPQPK